MKKVKTHIAVAKTFVYYAYEEIKIRHFQPSDLDDLYAILSEKEVMKYIEPPYSMEQTRDFLIHAGLGKVPLVYAVEKCGIFIGYVIFHEYDEDSYELGWVLGRKYWGKGYASIITKIMIEKAFAMKKDLVIECVPEQEKTKHIALSNGFSYIGNVDGLDVFKRKNRSDDNIKIMEILEKNTLDIGKSRMICRDIVLNSV